MQARRIQTKQTSRQSSVFESWAASFKYSLCRSRVSFANKTLITDKGTIDGRGHFVNGWFFVWIYWGINGAYCIVAQCIVAWNECKIKNLIESFHFHSFAYNKSNAMICENEMETRPIYSRLKYDCGFASFNSYLCSANSLAIYAIDVFVLNYMCWLQFGFIRQNRTIKHALPIIYHLRNK